MNDWGLIFVIGIGLLVGIQFLSIFLFDPLLKKKRGQDYKINKVLVASIFIYMFFMVIVLFLSLFGFFEYIE